jgi:hypothetical protein
LTGKINEPDNAPTLGHHPRYFRSASRAAATARTRVIRPLRPLLSWGKSWAQRIRYLLNLARGKAHKALFCKEMRVLKHGYGR